LVSGKKPSIYTRGLFVASASDDKPDGGVRLESLNPDIKSPINGRVTRSSIDSGAGGTNKHLKHDFNDFDEGTKKINAIIKGLENNSEGSTKLPQLSNRSLKAATPAK